MTGKDMLSQEEIDALLRQSANDLKQTKNIHDYLSPLEIDAIGEIGNITFGSASTALSTLLRQKVDITTPEVEIIEREDLEKLFPKPQVAVHVEYTEGFEGINLLVIRTEDARIIADLMLGGDGTNPGDLGEMEISACQEAMNQMMGSAATSMSTLFNKVINISPPGINIMDLSSGGEADQLLIDNVFVKVSFRLTIGNLVDSAIMQLIPVTFARKMVGMLIGSNSDEASTPPYDTHEVAIATPTASHNRSVDHVEYGRGYAQQPQFGMQQPSYMGQPNVHQANQENRSAHLSQQYIGSQGSGGRVPNVQSIQFTNFNKEELIPPHNEQNLKLLLDIPLQVTVELGRTKKLIKEILELSPGSIVELDKLAGEPVDILVNNKLVAKGEVVVIEENFGVRVTEIISHWERLQKLQ